MQTRRRLSLLFATFVGSAGPASAALAQQILILPYQPLGKNVPVEMTEQATVVVAKEMGSQGLSVVRGDDIPIPAGASGTSPKTARRRDPETPSGDPAAGPRAEQLIAKAKQMVEEGEFVVAVRDLKTAVKLLEENGDSVPDLRLLAEAYLQLGVAYFRNGDEDAGDEMLARSVHFDPERQLSESDYPNLFIRVFARARYNVLRRPRGVIEVKGPKGSQVLLDGRQVGKAPLLLKEVLPGTHWVRLERPGEPTQVRKLALKSGQTTLVELEATGATASEGASLGLLAAIGANELSAEHVQQLKAMATKAGATAVVLGAVYKTETAYNLRTLIVGAKDGSVGRLADVAFDLDMLSAEIEAFKLAEDVKKELAANARSRAVTEARFPVALGFKVKGDRREPAQAEPKVMTVAAAPPAPPAPQAAEVAEAESAETPKARTPSASGRRPVDAESEGRASAPAREVVPKDEEGSAPRVASVLAPSAAVTPVDELEPEREKPSTWWIWVLVGAAAVGAASAGGYLVATGGSPETGNLKITW